MKQDITGMTFEQALAALQAIVSKLEAGDVPLEQSLEHYERGVALARYCNEMLDQAELRVRELLPDNTEQAFSGPLDSRS